MSGIPTGENPRREEEIRPARGNPRANDAATASGSPPRYKTDLLTALASWPLITLLLVALGPLLARLPLVLDTLLLTVILVPVLSWVALPLLRRLFSRWLHPAARTIESMPQKSRSP